MVGNARFFDVECRVLEVDVHILQECSPHRHVDDRALDVRYPIEKKKEKKGGAPPPLRSKVPDFFGRSR